MSKTTILVGLCIYILIGLTIVYGTYYVTKQRHEKVGKSFKVKWYKALIMIAIYPFFLVKAAFEMLLDRFVV